VLHGYARESTADQNPNAQRDALLRAGVHPDQLYLDHTSGAKSSRPAWDALCKALRAGDVLVATLLDQVGRSTTHLVTLLDQLAGRGVAFRFLEQGVDTTTSEGRLMYRMLAAIAEFQRDLIIANTREGLAAARARGRKGGRKPKLTAIWLIRPVALPTGRITPSGRVATQGRDWTVSENLHEPVGERLGDKLT
jgi:DNA invertase Pin-like site-specific DNA recombinase